MRTYKKNINGRQIQIADYPVAPEDSGDPREKETIIAIHGLTGTHKNMHYYAEALKGENRFIALDLRGRGNSSKMDPEPSIFNHAKDVIDLINELEIECPVLMGHSMGAFIAAIVASQLKSVKGLILLDGAAQMSSHQQDIVKPSLGRLNKEYMTKEYYVKEVKELYGRLGVAWTPALQEVVEYEIHQVDDHWKHKSAGEKILEDFESFYSFNPKEIMQNVLCKTLLVYAKGEIGPLPPLFLKKDYDVTRQHTPNLTMITSDCNHYTMVFEKRDEINKMIIDFLEEVK